MVPSIIKINIKNVLFHCYSGAFYTTHLLRIVDKLFAGCKVLQGEDVTVNGNSPGAVVRGPFSIIKANLPVTYDLGPLPHPLLKVLGILFVAQVVSGLLSSYFDMLK